MSRSRFSELADRSPTAVDGGEDLRDAGVGLPRTLLISVDKGY